MKRIYYVNNIRIAEPAKLRFPELSTINELLNEINPRIRTTDELLAAYARSYVLMNCDIEFDYELLEIPSEQIRIYKPNQEWSADLSDCKGLPEQEYEIKLSYPKSIFVQYAGNMTEYDFLPEKEREEQLVYDYIRYYLPLNVTVLREQQ